VRTLGTSVLYQVPFLLLSAAPPVHAETPVAQALVDYDGLVSQLKVGSVVGEPIRVADTTVIPLAVVRFGLAAGQAPVGFAGGMSAKAVPLGVVIVEGDDVRVELLPESHAGPTVVEQLLQEIRDRKVVFMGNGVNVAQSSGSVQDLAPVVSGMMGQTTVVGNALNLASFSPIAPGSSASPPLEPIQKDLEAAVARRPSAEGYVCLGEALRRQGLEAEAVAAYRKALELEPGYPPAVKALAGAKERDPSSR